MEDQNVARSGWVFRQTSILKHWKKVWLVLYQTGELRYFEDPSSRRAKDALFMPETLQIRVGDECKHVHPPNNLSTEFLFTVVPRHGSYWQMSAESLDDRTAWQIALQEARELRTSLRRTVSRDALYPSLPIGAPPVGHYAYMPGGYANGGLYQPPGYVYETAPGQVTQVYYVDRPGRYYRGSDFAVGMIGGAAAGTLIGTTMMWPLMWC